MDNVPVTGHGGKTKKEQTILLVYFSLLINPNSYFWTRELILDNRIISFFTTTVADDTSNEKWGNKFFV
jgi:hypothetical protein